MHFSQRVAYMLSGLAGRITQHPSCPACGDSGGSTRDRKWFHTLIECQRCLLLYRFPVESPRAMSDFYDVGYSEPRMTTELPDDKQLSELLEYGLKGREKDFTYYSSILSAFESAREWENPRFWSKLGLRVLAICARWRCQIV